MEDVAGNSLRRIFDADLTRDRAARDQSDDCVRRRFTVAPAS
jgi:hypothetical protein